jgi:hypothetical protein
MECEFCQIERADRRVPTRFGPRELCNSCAEIHGRRSPVAKPKSEPADGATSAVHRPKKGT